MLVAHDLNQRLVVDDVPANVKLLEARLMAEYFDVLTASNGRDALDICDRTQVDVILLDIMMPEMDGFEVCERLKSSPHTAHIPVVMVTALDQVEDRVRGLEAGADDFLSKEYFNHFQGRHTLAIQTYLIITKNIRRNIFFNYSNSSGLSSFPFL